jgi:hypothetical protein
VRAYKVLIDGRSGFTGWRWPLPDGDGPGEWVLASGTPELCVSGIHACTVDQLPQWLGEELWTIELAGEIVHSDAALVASKDGCSPEYTRGARRREGRSDRTAPGARGKTRSTDRSSL